MLGCGCPVSPEPAGRGCVRVSGEGGCQCDSGDSPAKAHCELSKASAETGGEGTRLLALGRGEAHGQVQELFCLGWRRPDHYNASFAEYSSGIFFFYSV